MTAAIDLQQLAVRENEQTEWKDKVADADDVVATLSAFANDLQNMGGGYVVCGAKEDKDDNGFPLLVRTGLTATEVREIEGKVLNRCRERVSPPIAPRVEELPSATPDRRILVFVQPATDQAHTFRRINDGAKHYIRVSRSTIEARNGTLRELLVRKGAMEPWDRRPCNAASLADVDLLALRDALQRMGVLAGERGVETYLSEDVQLSPFVPPLCTREPLSGVLRPRNFTMLLFGRAVQRFIPGAVSLFSIYPGTDRSDPVAARHELAGTLLDQVRQLDTLLKAQVVVMFDKTNTRTPNTWSYPERALHEAMINALAHRDYTLVDPTRIVAYGDRIEMLSPGSLPSGVKIEDLQRGVVTPRWRNQSLAWFLNRLQLAQAEGQGIVTIRRLMQDIGSPPPEFEASEAWVSCVLRTHPRWLASVRQGLANARGSKRRSSPRPRKPHNPGGSQ